MAILRVTNPDLVPILTLLEDTSDDAKSAVGGLKKAKRKVSAYQRRYGKAYKQLRKKYTTAKGAYRKGYNHKRIVKLAHKLAKRGGK